MIKTQVDKTSNLLLIRYAGRVGPAETRSGVEQLPGLLAEFQPGFRLLTDLSGLELMDLECEPHLKRMMDL
jgi:hypothetical protein